MFNNPLKSEDQNSFAERRRMVEEQLRGRGIRDERVLAAMAKVPREEFVAANNLREAYGDHPLSIGEGQTISQPYIVASMLQVLQVAQANRVLEVGSGTGYEAAVLGELAREVWTIERNPNLAARAQEILSRLGYRHVHVVPGDGSLGLPEQAPFDRILVAAAAPDVPKSLVVQLADDGRLVIPVGSRTDQQVQIIRKTEGETILTLGDLCRFVPLLGEEGWQS